MKLKAGVTEYVKESHRNYQSCFDDPTCGLHEMCSVVEKECVGHISDVLTTCDTYYPKFEIRKGLQSSVCTRGIPNWVCLKRIHDVILYVVEVYC